MCCAVRPCDTRAWHGPRSLPAWLADFFAQADMCEGVRVASWSAGGEGGPPVCASWRQAVAYLDPRPVAEVGSGLVPPACARAPRCVPAWRKLKTSAGELPMRGRCAELLSAHQGSGASHALCAGGCPPSGRARLRCAQGEAVRVRVRWDAGQLHFAAEPPACCARHAIVPRWHFDMVLDEQARRAHRRPSTYFLTPKLSLLRSWGWHRRCALPGYLCRQEMLQSAGRCQPYNLPYNQC